MQTNAAAEKSTSISHADVEIQMLEGTKIRAKKVVIRCKYDSTVAIPVLILHPEGPARHTVIGLAQDGKAGFLKHRAETIAELLKRNVTVYLPDLRGTGEAKRRRPWSTERRYLVFRVAANAWPNGARSAASAIDASLLEC